MPFVWLLFHALMLRWHFDMVQDHMRNDAYDQAISRVSLLISLILTRGLACLHSQVALSNGPRSPAQ